MTYSSQNTNSILMARALTESTGSQVTPLLETTLHRVFTKHALDGYFIISASRSEYGAAENRSRTDRLEQEIKSLGRYSYLPVSGGFVETVGATGIDGDVTTDPDAAMAAGTRVEVLEDAFLVMNRYPATTEEGKEEFVMRMLDDAKTLCGKYDQQSVLVQLPGQYPMYITAEGVNDGTFDGVTTFNNMLKMYFTKLHRGPDTKFSHSGSHGRFSLRTKEEQAEDDAKYGIVSRTCGV